MRGPQGQEYLPLGEPEQEQAAPEPDLFEDGTGKGET